MKLSTRLYVSIVLVALAVALAAMVPPVAAQPVDGPADSDEPMNSDFEMRLGLGVSRTPAYLGSDERKTRALPLIAARWRSGWFAGINGVGYRFNAGQPLSGGLRLNFDRGRDEDDADALLGMGDIDARPEIGAFANWRILPGWGLSSALHYGSGNDRDGLLLDIGARGMMPLTPTVRLTAGVGATFANTKSMQSLFGVTAEQSLTSGYSP
jgi:MipA family protein